MEKKSFEVAAKILVGFEGVVGLDSLENLFVTWWAEVGFATR